MRVSGKALAIACKAANLHCTAFCAARHRISLETEKRRKTHLRRRDKRHEKSPRFSAGAGRENQMVKAARAAAKILSIIFCSASERAFMLRAAPLYAAHAFSRGILPLQ